MARSLPHGPVAQCCLALRAVPRLGSRRMNTKRLGDELAWDVVNDHAFSGGNVPESNGPDTAGHRNPCTALPSSLDG